MNGNTGNSSVVLAAVLCGSSAGLQKKRHAREVLAHQYYSANSGLTFHSLTCCLKYGQYR
jgi:hypothetical protein